jgi:uncharacterized membrane protein YdbT with pleckstrin-like domain
MESQNYVPSHKQFRSLTVGDWLITLFIQSIPIVGFIMLFVWAFGDNTHPSKKTWAQASLIFLVAIAVLSIIFLMLAGGIFMSLFEAMNYDYSA